jgi:hypothetical protein
MTVKRNKITRENLSERLLEAADSLLELARQSCWNNISSNCSFILSEINNSSNNFIEETRLNKKLNAKKQPERLDSVIPHLLLIYTNLYEIDLYIYRSSKKLTVIEIAYYLKSSLEPEYQETIADDPPMLYCKVAIPSYKGTFTKYNASNKFDINWQHNTIYHQGNMFWFRFRNLIFR